MQRCSGVQVQPHAAPEPELPQLNEAVLLRNVRERRDTAATRGEMKPDPSAVNKVALAEYFGFPCQFSFPPQVLDIQQTFYHRRYLVSIPKRHLNNQLKLNRPAR
jgi:hypothetical protein